MCITETDIDELSRLIRGVLDKWFCMPEYMGSNPSRGNICLCYMCTCPSVLTVLWWWWCLGECGPGAWSSPRQWPCPGPSSWRCGGWSGSPSPSPCMSPSLDWHPSVSCATVTPGCDCSTRLASHLSLLPQSNEGKNQMRYLCC